MGLISRVSRRTYRPILKEIFKNHQNGRSPSQEEEDLQEVLLQGHRDGQTPRPQHRRALQCSTAATGGPSAGVSPESTTPSSTAWPRPRRTCPTRPAPSPRPSRPTAGT